ncbi:MAG TPA: SusC/RagA family TonB-linked outer membrane protein [Membranihabitans sp.]|nr:SusC/RagA family TonB-linked outer membrane protein [Membranihabitans sp.]
MKKIYLILWLILCQQLLMAQGDMVMNLYANTHVSQKLVPDNSLLGILDQIEKKFNVFFNFDPELIADQDIDKEVTISDDLNETLDRILNPLGLIYQKLGSSYYVIFAGKKSPVKKKVEKMPDLPKSNEGMLQGRNTKKFGAVHPLSPRRSNFSQLMRYGFDISGQVVDEKGEPLIGVNIQIKGTNSGTSSDLDGGFVLEDVDENAVLVVSYIGYLTQEVSVGGRTSISITMISDSQLLDEVVVVGYGSVRKRDLTGAIAQIDPAEKQDELTSNIGDLLRNNLAGLYIPFSANPKGSVDMSNVLIRGTNSLLASNTPLIVLDGMIYDGDLANINPMDIEKIDVMKDASAAAIYGSRAANGVIIITTKTGVRQQPQINFNLNMGVSTPSFLREVYDEEEYLDMHAIWSSYNLPRDEQGFYARPDQLPSGVSLDQWMGYTNASGDPMNVWLARIGLYQTEINNFNAGNVINWEDEIFQTGLRQDYQLSISGGSERMKYYLSGNYTNNEGFVKGEGYESIRARLNIENQVADFLTIGINTQFANRDESSIPAQWMAYRWGSPYASKYEEDGTTLKYLTYDYNLSRNPFYEGAYTNRFWKYNDLDSRIYGIVDLPLDIKYQINYVNNLRTSRFYNHVSSLSEENTSDGEATRINRTTYTWIIDNILSWNKNWGSHDIGVTFMANSERRRYWNDEMSNSGFTPTDILGYNAIGLGLSPRLASDDGTHTRDALLGRINYSYDYKYYLTVATRRDGYSAFGQANPRATFPTLAVAWAISEEDFFDNNVFDFLKLRLSWGANGNSSIGTYSALAVMEDRRFLYSIDGNAVQTTELRLARMANNALQWEKTTSVNAGLDFGIVNNTLSGALEVYNSITSGLLVNRQLPSVTGYGSVAANLGEIENRGVELTLRSLNLQSANGLIWKSDFNLALNRNKIVSLYGDLVDVIDENGNIIGEEEASDPGNGWFIGESIDIIWDYDSDGIWQQAEREQADAYGGFFPGQFKNVDVNGDGQYDSEDRQFLGHSTPQFRWNLSNEFKYKNASLSFSIYGQHGHIANFTDYAGTGLFETGNGYKMPYWTPENNSNKYPGMRGAGGTNYLGLDFVRLNNITLGYKFSPQRINRLGIRSLNVFTNVYNVAMWTKWPGWDPENIEGPSPRYYNLGINIGL